MKFMLEEKAVNEIEYKTRRVLKIEYPELIAAPSVTQWLKDEKSDSYFRHQMKNPNSCIAKAVKAGKQAHSVLETGNTKTVMDEAVLSCFNDDIMPDIDRVVGCEQTVVHPTGFNGKFDLMCKFRDEYTIVDYKKTNKRRTPSTLKSYFQQICSYRLAHNFLYPSHNITQVAIVNIYGTDADDIRSNVIILNDTQMEDYESQFLLRVSSGECVGY